jgi:hypothetical protein
MNKHSHKKVDLFLVAASAGILTLAAIAIFLGLFMVNRIMNPPAPDASEVAIVAAPPLNPDRVENGVDVETGFIAEGDYMIVKRTCTPCHLAKLVTQNRATREGWLEMIRWMQATQKLWDLGDNEAVILNYLAKHYGPEDKGRRQNIEIEEWYEISMRRPQHGTASIEERHKLLSWINND